MLAFVVVCAVRSCLERDQFFFLFLFFPLLDIYIYI